MNENFNRYGHGNPYLHPQAAVYHPQTLFFSQPSMQAFDSAPGISNTSSGRASGRVTTNKAKTKSADWTVNETKDLIRIWGPHYEKLKGVSNKDRIRIWNQIYEEFRKKSQPDNGRALPQVKKRLQNLEYEFKQLKLRARTTGEEGLLKIKNNFPYYDMLDEVMGYRDSVNPDLMEIESSSFLPINDYPVSSSESSTPTPPIGSTSSDSEHESEPHSANMKGEQNGDRSAASTVTKRGSTSGKHGKEKKRKVQKSKEDETEIFKEMWERSQQQENERFEKCIEMIERTQKLQIEQTNAIVTGFKDLFKDLLQK